MIIHFNPRTPCGVRLRISELTQRMLDISIHAPLAGCDPKIIERRPTMPDFNPRTPCGVRPLSSTTLRTAGSFQSTHPLRGATL